MWESSINFTNKIKFAIRITFTEYEVSNKCYEVINTRLLIIQDSKTQVQSASESFLLVRVNDIGRVQPVMQGEGALVPKFKLSLKVEPLCYQYHQQLPSAEEYRVTEWYHYRGITIKNKTLLAKLCCLLLTAMPHWSDHLRKQKEISVNKWNNKIDWIW